MKMQTIDIKIQNTTEVKQESKLFTLGCQRSYCECKVFPIFSRALGGAIENGSEKKETKSLWTDLKAIHKGNNSI